MAKEFLFLPPPLFRFSHKLLFTSVFYNCYKQTHYNVFINNAEYKSVIEEYIDSIRSDKRIIDYISELDLGRDLFYIFNQKLINKSGYVFDELRVKNYIGNSKKRIIKEFDIYLNKLRKINRNIAAVHYIKLSKERLNGSISFVFLISEDFFPKGCISSFLSEIINERETISKYLINALNEIETELYLEASLQSALVSIMSRNTSHNVGSHVLSRLSSGEIAEWTKGKSKEEIEKSICEDDSEKKIPKEIKKDDLVSWIFDARYILKYLQQRQDFLAAISTEWPNWINSAFLMGDVMKWFLMQKNLLDNIAASEKLTAHKYRKKNLYDIRFHLFLCPEDKWAEKCKTLQERYKQIMNNNKNHIILYTKGDKEISCLDKDPSLGILGGIIGYHAFYIILENIIRNAAKHSYLKYRKNHLDIIIEILDDPGDKIGINMRGQKLLAYLFRIYDNVSKIDDADKEKVLLWNKAKDNGMDGINDKLGRSFIDETGALKKEDWGLAELKISAGYLQNRDVIHIGDKNEMIYGKVKKSLKELGEELSGSKAIIRAIKSPIGTLGYEFYIIKPKQVGLVVCN